MGNFTFSEVITIVIVILIVFGPQRLPELARKAGALASRARAALDSVRAELDAEYGDVIQPLREARDDMRAVGKDIRGQVDSFAKEVSEAGKEVKAAADNAIEETVQELETATGKPVNQIAAGNAWPPPEEPPAGNGSAQAEPAVPDGTAESDDADTQLEEAEGG